MRQDWPPRIATGWRSTGRIEDLAITLDEHEIAAPPHRFYNQHHPVQPLEGVSLFAVQLEHALQRRLTDGFDSRVSQMLANQQTEGGIAFHATCWKLPDTLDPPTLQVPREQDIGAAYGWREKLDGEAELVNEHQLLHTGARQQRLQLIAHRCQ